MTKHYVLHEEAKPYCPRCGGRMRLIKPLGDKEFDPFWACIADPDCKGRREIDDEGWPEEPERYLGRAA